MDLNNNKSYDIRELIIRYITNELSEDELESFSQQLSVDIEARKLTEEMVTSWRYASLLGNQLQDDERAAFSKLEQRITNVSDEEEPESKSEAGKMNKKRLWFRISVAAAIIVAFLGGGITYSVLSNDQIKLNPKDFHIATPYGTRSELILPDGSKVWLNAGSILSYSESYNSRNRDINLIGEAYFEVAKNKEQPFNVMSGGLQIKALGTAFNIKAYPEDSLLVATLIEGQIVVEGKSKDKNSFSFELEPKQTITFLKAKTFKPLISANDSNILPIPKVEERAPAVIESLDLKSNVNTILYTSWKDKRWIIERESFSSLSVMLERRFNVHINYNSTEMEVISFTGTIENETLEQVLNILQLSAPIRYEFGKGEVSISIDNARKKLFKSLM